MVTTTMTPDEILIELQKDMPALIGYSDTKQKKVDKIIRKSSVFPVRIKSTMTSRRNNKWLLCWVANNKKMTGDDCLFYWGCLVDSHMGVFLMVPQLAQGVWNLLIYSPHFFQQYAKRNNVPLTGEKLRHHFLLRNNSCSIHPTPEDWTTKKRGCMATMTEGMALGHCDESDNAVLFRTFVSYDMIQEGQMKDVLASEYLRKVIHGY